ncbi:hypothetical protein FQN57_003291 [Myotisia sp. PD_48]|nr:hypothetical protein FQN57_003291 [Myotisia sp. PD_48]
MVVQRQPDSTLHYFPPMEAPTFVTIADIDQEKARVLKHVISSILHNEITRDIFAQVIDGLPINRTYEFVTTGRSDLDSRTVVSEQAKLSSQQFCDSSEMLDNLILNAKIAQQLQASQLYSAAFNMHLLELAALIIHDMAGNLFTTFHPNGEPGEDMKVSGKKDGVSLSTGYFARNSEFPRGSADSVGYWAETHIFGGVVMFDRGPNEGARNCNGAYIHPPKFDNRMFQLTELQLLRFSQGGDKLNLPFVHEPGARQVDRYEAFSELNIHRDRHDWATYKVGPPVPIRCCRRQTEVDRRLTEFAQKMRETTRCQQYLPYIPRTLEAQRLWRAEVAKERERGVADPADLLFFHLGTGLGNPDDNSQQ